MASMTTRRICTQRRAQVVIRRHLRGYLCRALRARLAFPMRDACPICIDDGVGRVGLRLHCGHEFHASCVARWVGIEPSCPLCRAPCTDARRERLAARFERVQRYVALPIETLLHFSCVLPVALLLDAEEPSASEVDHVLRAAERTPGGAIDAHVLIQVRLRWAAVRECRAEIQRFDAGGCEPALAESAAVRFIAARLAHPFEHLHGRTCDPWFELSKLQDSTGAFARAVRARLCQFWRIEQLLKGVPSSTSATERVPFPARNLSDALTPHVRIVPRREPNQGAFNPLSRFRLRTFATSNADASDGEIEAGPT